MGHATRQQSSKRPGSLFATTPPRREEDVPVRMEFTTKQGDPVDNAFKATGPLSLPSTWQRKTKPAADLDASSAHDQDEDDDDDDADEEAL